MIINIWSTAFSYLNIQNNIVQYVLILCIQVPHTSSRTVIFGSSTISGCALNKKNQGRSASSGSTVPPWMASTSGRRPRTGAGWPSPRDRTAGAGGYRPRWTGRPTKSPRRLRWTPSTAACYCRRSSHSLPFACGGERIADVHCDTCGYNVCNRCQTPVYVQPSIATRAQNKSFKSLLAIARLTSKSNRLNVIIVIYHGVHIYM